MILNILKKTDGTIPSCEPFRPSCHRYMLTGVCVIAAVTLGVFSSFTLAGSADILSRFDHTIAWLPGSIALSCLRKQLSSNQSTLNLNASEQDGRNMSMDVIT